MLTVSGHRAAARRVLGTPSDVREAPRDDAMDLTDIEKGRTVVVTGTLEQAFDLPTFEDDVQQDLEDELFEDYDQQAYLLATDVSALPGD